MACKSLDDGDEIVFGRSYETPKQRVLIPIEPIEAAIKRHVGWYERPPDQTKEMVMEYGKLLGEFLNALPESFAIVVKSRDRE